MILAILVVYKIIELIVAIDLRENGAEAERGRENEVVIETNTSLTEMGRDSRAEIVLMIDAEVERDREKGRGVETDHEKGRGVEAMNEWKDLDFHGQQRMGQVGRKTEVLSRVTQVLNHLEVVVAGKLLTDETKTERRTERRSDRREERRRIIGEVPAVAATPRRKRRKRLRRKKKPPF